jgi:hypothetical protein
MAVGTFLPPGSGYTKIYSNRKAFAALTRNGSIKTWGFPYFGGKNAPNVPTGKGYTKVYSTGSAFAALKANGIEPSALRAAKAYAFE